ncbi:unnamed protein product [Allacma fusca]|uniref:Uncharacterized protein n=1 Tax=Allacma fusca TaxID=39272 RepID=A0A8J2L2N0_9HEXA|nr:unnamed protein product [Allacma fusca]
MLMECFPGPRDQPNKTHLNVSIWKWKNSSGNIGSSLKSFRHNNTHILRSSSNPALSIGNEKDLKDRSLISTSSHVRRSSKSETQVLSAYDQLGLKFEEMLMYSGFGQVSFSINFKLYFYPDEIHTKDPKICYCALLYLSTLGIGNGLSAVTQHWAAASVTTLTKMNVSSVIFTLKHWSFTSTSLVSSLLT